MLLGAEENHRMDVVYIALALAFLASSWALLELCAWLAGGAR
jgi:hypothetical protein